MTDRFGAEEEMPGGQKSEVNERYGDFSTATKRSTLLLEPLERCVTCSPGEEKEIVPKGRRELNVGGC
jgi:hypothetical protein